MQFENSAFQTRNWTADSLVSFVIKRNCFFFLDQFEISFKIHSFINSVCLVNLRNVLIFYFSVYINVKLCEALGLKYESSIPHRTCTNTSMRHVQISRRLLLDTGMLPTLKIRPWFKKICGIVEHTNISALPSCLWLIHYRRQSNLTFLRHNWFVILFYFINT